MSAKAVVPTVSTTGRRAAARIGGRALWAAAALLIMLAGLGVSDPARAGAVCGDRGQILERLHQKHHESRQALGLSADGGVLELLVSPEGGWTILVTYPARATCVVAVGKAWQTLALNGRPA